jgi:hypothetical protein
LDTLPVKLRLDEGGLPGKMEGVTEQKNIRVGVLGAAVFWGSLWGIGEATAGHILHLLRVPGIAGLIMFPAGFFLMSRAFDRSGKPAAIFLTACTAAAIKLTDLVIPGSDVFSVINPAQAILLESLAVMGIFSFLKRTGRISLLPPLLASVFWRLAYVFLGVLVSQVFPIRNLLETGPVPLLRYLLVDGSANGYLIYLILRMQKSSSRSGRSSIQPVPAVYSFLCFAAAVLIEFVV